MESRPAQTVWGEGLVEQSALHDSVVFFSTVSFTSWVFKKHTGHGFNIEVVEHICLHVELCTRLSNV